MKAFYETPDVEIVAFENEDIITTSSEQTEETEETVPMLPFMPF